MTYGYRPGRLDPRLGAAAMASYGASRCQAIAAYAKYAGDGMVLAEFAGSGSKPAFSAVSEEEFTNLLELRSLDGSTQLRQLKNAGTVKGGRSVTTMEFVTTISKDQSLAWALGDEGLREAVEARIALLNEAKMRVLSENLITRVGGREDHRMVRGEGMRAVMFMHHDSRAGDPHLHIHDSVINDTIGTDGRHHALMTVYGLSPLSPLLYAIERWGMASNREYRQAFADRGLRLNPDGSVEGMEAMREAASKRRDQAEANYKRLVDEWRERNGTAPDEEPPARTAQKFRQLAWETGRPAKEHRTDDDERARWADEFGPLPQGEAFTVEAGRAVDWTRLAHEAVERCTNMGPAFSRWQLEARIVELAGERGADVLAELERIDRLTTDALNGQIDLAMGLNAEDLGGMPRYTTAAVLEREQRIRDLVDRLDARRFGVDPDDMPDLSGLSDDQRLAVLGLRGSVSGVEVVEGAAGAGKTTMLAKASRGVGVVALAPSRKAANELGEALGCNADSVQKFLWDRGWRRDDAGALSHETALRRWDGAGDPARGRTIIVDETGMLRQDDAAALLEEADRLGCRVWLVGDRSQLPAVGAGGVLQLAIDATGRHMELDSIHRFQGRWGEAYGEFSKQLRERRDPEGAFDRLAGLAGPSVAGECLAKPFADADGLAAWIAGQWTEKTAVTVPDNARARLVGRLVHERLKAEGRARGPAAHGREGAEFMAGDLIAVRRNERDTGLVNRQVWHVDRVNPDGSVQATLTESRHPRSVRIDAAYLAGNAEHGYAATPWGVQGVTMDRSITWMDENSTANMLYVGQTRGRYSNVVAAVADGLDGMKRMYADAYRNEAATGLVSEASAQVREQVARLQKPARPLDAAAARELDAMERWAGEDAAALRAELERATAMDAAEERVKAAEERVELAHGTAERLTGEWRNALAPLNDAVNAAERRLNGVQTAVGDRVRENARIDAQAVQRALQGGRNAGDEYDAWHEAVTQAGNGARKATAAYGPGLPRHERVRIFRDVCAADLERLERNGRGHIRLDSIDGRRHWALRSAELERLAGDVADRMGRADAELRRDDAMAAEFRARWRMDWRDALGDGAQRLAVAAVEASGDVMRAREELQAARNELADNPAANAAKAAMDAAKTGEREAREELRAAKAALDALPRPERDAGAVRADLAAIGPRDGQTPAERHEQLAGVYRDDLEAMRLAEANRWRESLEGPDTLALAVDEASGTALRVDAVDGGQRLAAVAFRFERDSEDGAARPRPDSARETPGWAAWCERQINELGGDPALAADAIARGIRQQTGVNAVDVAVHQERIPELTATLLNDRAPGTYDPVMRAASPAYGGPDVAGPGM